MRKSHVHFKRTLAATAVATMAALITTGTASASHATEDCTPSNGTPSVTGAWAWDSFTDWSASDTTPGDPDSATGEDNLANVIQIGEGWSDTNDSAYRQEVSDGWKRFTSWQTSDVAPSVGANEEAGHRYEQVVGNGDATEGVKGYWQEFSPNKDQGPLEGPPSWPTDGRGTWSDSKVEGGPQQDASGVFHNGEGNGSWFYRAQGTQGTSETTHIEYRWDVYAFHFEYRWSVYERTNVEGADPVPCDDEEQPPTGGEEPGDENPGTPPTNTPSVPTEVKGETAQTPSSVPSAPHAAHASSQPTQSHTPGNNTTAVPLSIDAGL